jgi:hypothetical protein
MRIQKERKKGNQQSSLTLKYDPLTEQIAGLLRRIPRLGAPIAGIYLWKPMMFNYMLVGATGTVLNWFLYEIIVRPLVYWFWGGTFLGVTLVTICVFLWNFTWNKRWSLKTDAQMMAMTKQQLLNLKEKAEVLLIQKRDFNGKRVQS